MTIDLQIISCGTHIVVKMGGYKAIITAATIRFTKVQYEISYFHDGDYKTAWLDEAEFDISDVKKKRTSIGFRPH